MAVNAEKLRSQIAKAIAQLPQSIDLKRITRTGDDYNYTETETDVATFDSFIDLSKSRTASDKTLESEAGLVKRTEGVKLLTVWESSFEIKPDDYFILGNMKYKVILPSNNYNIYWDVTLEVMKNE